jgi:hypothetical protein
MNVSPKVFFPHPDSHGAHFSGVRTGHRKEHSLNGQIQCSSIAGVAEKERMPQRRRHQQS